MLNIWASRASSLWSFVSPKVTRYAGLQARLLSSFSARHIYQETSEESGTLLARFAKHIAMEGYSNGPNVEPTPTEIKYSDYFPVTDVKYFQRELRKTRADQLPSLVIFASIYRPNADPGKYANILNELDRACCEQLPSMNEITLLRLLNAWLFLIPSWLTRTDFYHASLGRLAEKDFKAEMSKEQFVEFSFFLGMNKNHIKTQHILKSLMTRQLEQKLPEMNTMDLVVVANAAYKSSTHLNSEAYNQRLEQEVLSMPLDGAYDALLITLIKAMRFQRVTSPAVCEKLTCLCLSAKDMKRMQHRGLVHILAYFAAQLWDKTECLDAIVKEYFKRLSHANDADSYVSTFRTKDVSTFLFACAQLNCEIPPKDLDYLESIVQQHILDNNFRYNPDQLVDCSLWLWLLGCKSRQLFQETMKLKSKYRIKQGERPKLESRYTVLLSVAEIEEPSWLPASIVQQKESAFKEDAIAPEYLLKDRPDLKQCVEYLRRLEGVAEATIVCPLSGLNIPSIMVRLDGLEQRTLYLELLMPEQTLKFSGQPFAVQRLKERLLKSLGYKVVTANSDEVGHDYNILKSKLGLPLPDEHMDLKKSVNGI